MQEQPLYFTMYFLYIVMFMNASYNWHFGTRGMSFGRIMKKYLVILIVSRQKQIQLYMHFSKRKRRNIF